MTAPDFEGDTYPVTQSGPVPAPLTLAEVREAHKRASTKVDGVFALNPIDTEKVALCATIEWLAERVQTAWYVCAECPHGPRGCTTHECDAAEIEVADWLRGEA